MLITQGPVLLEIYCCPYSQSAYILQIAKSLKQNFNFQLFQLVCLSTRLYQIVQSFNISKFWVMCNETAGLYYSETKNIRNIYFMSFL